MPRTAACPSGALVLRPVAGYRGRLHPDLRRQAAGQDRRPSRARRVPRLPPRRRHPRHPGPGPAIPAPAEPDHHRGRAAPPRHRVPVRHEALDTTTPGGRLVFHVFAALAEFIRELIVEGTNEGLAATKARGVRLGRPPAMTSEQIQSARTLLAQPEHSVSSIAKLLGVSRSTI